MVYPQHLLLRVGGSLYGKAQAWSCGFRYASAAGDGGGFGVAGIQAKLESWRDGVRALNSNNVWPSPLLDRLSAAGTLDTIRASYIGASGKEEALALVELNPVVHGTSAGNQIAQVCAAATLRTNRPGASYRGRVYLPMLHQDIAIDGRIAAGDAVEIASNLAGWIHQVGIAGSSIFTPQVIPAVVSGTKGTATQIQSVAVGSRLDIQRRRADQQDEAYSVSVIPQ